MNKKYRNYGLWLAAASLLPIVLDSMNFYGFNLQLPGNYDLLVKGLLGFLALAGIISNPSQGKLFKDE